MQMPTIQLAELLPILPEVQTQMARESDPISVSLLDLDPAIVERQEDLGVGVRIEGRLEADLEFVGVEVFPLHARRGRVRPYIPGCADFGIELRLIALPADEPARPRRIGRLCRVPADHRCSR